jgi:hypothetical protein
MQIVGPLTYRDLIPIGTAIAGYVAGTLKVAAANVRERRKALNTTLYALLKLRSEARSGNPRELLLQVRRFMVARFGVGVVDLITRPELRSFIYRTVQDASTAKMTVAIDQYREAVKALAPFYPLLAHRLDADRAANLQTLIRGYYERVRLQTDLPEVHSDPQAMDLMEDQTLDLAFTKALERLSDDIHAVAGKLWWLSRRAALSALRQQDRPADDEDFEKQAHGLFDTLQNHMMAVETNRGSSAL